MTLRDASRNSSLFIVKFREPIGALGLIDRFTDAYRSTCFGRGFFRFARRFLSNVVLAQFSLLKSFCDHSVVRVDSCGTNTTKQIKY